MSSPETGTETDTDTETMAESEVTEKKVGRRGRKEPKPPKPPKAPKPAKGKGRKNNDKKAKKDKGAGRGKAAKGHHPRPALPSVNLLSPSAFERMATRRLRLRFIAAGAALVVLVVAAWAVQHLRVNEAEQLLTVEQAETARLTEETQVLLPVRAYVTGVEQQKTLVSETMATEIYFSTVLEGLQDDAPSGVRLESVAVTLAPPPAAPVPAPTTEGTEGAETTEGEAAAPAPAPLPTVSPCPGPDPFNTRVVVGCITVSGTADSRAEVGDFVIRLGDDKLFVEPFISTTTTADAARVQFSGSVGLSEKVFSKRYADLDALLATGGGS